MPFQPSAETGVSLIQTLWPMTGAPNSAEYTAVEMDVSVAEGAMMPADPGGCQNVLLKRRPGDIDLLTANVPNWLALTVSDSAAMPSPIEALTVAPVKSGSDRSCGGVVGSASPTFSRVAPMRTYI